MKKLISLILSVMLIVSVIPLTLPQAAALDRMVLDTEYTVHCSSPGDWKVYTFVPQEDGVYIFSSSGSLDTMGYIALAEGEAENEYIKADGGQDDNFAVTYNMKAGTTYYLGSTVLAYPTGSYGVKIVKFEIDDGTIHPLPVSTSTSVTSRKELKLKFYSFTPTTSGKYVYSSSGDYDTQGYIFDEYWRQIAYSDIGGTAQNFQIVLDLMAGQTYYFGYATTSTTSASFSILVYMRAFIRNVSLVSGPEKNTYYKDIDAKRVGENTYHVDLNLAEFSFMVKYSNGDEETKEYTHGIRGLDCQTSTDLSAGENNVRFSYFGNSSYFVIFVKDSPIDRLQVLQPPTKTIYYDEDKEKAVDDSYIFNISIYEMVFRAQFKDGTTNDFTITSLYGEEIDYFYFDHVVPENEMQLGENTFTVTYYDVTAQFTVRYSLNSDNWEYRIDGDTVTLTKYIGTDAQAVIPQELAGKPVTVIGESCFENNTTITNVRMTEQITEIGRRAFYGCSNLKELTLPASLQTIGAQACYGTTGMERLTWNTPQLEIVRNNNTFASMGKETQNGTTVEFGFTCTAVPENAFYNSSSSYAPKISKIIIGENVCAIGANAFRELSALRKVEWNATKITSSLGTANNIWLYSGGTDASFEVEFGEDVQSLPNNLFYAANAGRAPRVSKVTAHNKDMTIETATFIKNENVPLTFYCHYNDESSVPSVYRYCIERGWDYVLLDSPVDRIYIKAPMEKEEYIIGEDLSTEGLLVYAVYEDYSEKNVTDEIQISGYQKDLLGTQQLTITYTFIDKTLTIPYTVVVTEEPLVLDYLVIDTPATVTRFYTGDVFESTGLSVSAVFTNGMQQDVSDYLIVSGYDMQHAGMQTVQVAYSYEGVTRTITYGITVQELILEQIYIESFPDKTNYLAGEDLDVDGLKVVAEYNSGRTADVSGYCTFSGYDMEQVGNQQVTILYEENAVGKTAEFSITVHNDLLRIQLDELPVMTTYTVGSGFSYRGIQVSAFYENGTQKDVSNALQFSGYDLNTIGTQQVIVTYTEGGISKSVSYEITVNDTQLLRLDLMSAPTATQYKDEALDITGLHISAMMNDGSRQNVAAQCVLSGYDMAQAGVQTVTATYTHNNKSLSVQFDIEVKVRTAAGIVVTKLPNRLQYDVGEALDTTGMEVALIFQEDASQKRIETDELSISGYDAGHAGEQTITLSYTYKGTPFTTSFNVMLINYETAITVHAPLKTAYFYGEAFQPEGMYITVHMADGSEQNLQSGFTYAGYQAQKLGTQTITVTYSDTVKGQALQDTFNVSVQNYTASIRVTAPSKVDYYYGESLNLVGMSVRATMANGEKKLLPLNAISCDGYDAATLGEQEILVSYSAETGDVLYDSFLVNVSNYATALEVTPPTQREYFYADEMNPEGMACTAVMADGSTEAVSPQEVTLTGYDAYTVGTQTVSAQYHSQKGTVLSDTFTVSVRNFETDIVVTPPQTTVYFYGDTPSVEGMKAVATMADGSVSEIEAEALSVQGLHTEQLGTTRVTVTYENQKGMLLQDGFDITVKNFATILSVHSVEKSVYYYAEPFENSTVGVTVVMADGSEQTPDVNTLVFTGYQATALGEQTVSVQYINEKEQTLEDSFHVTVADYETALVVTPPAQTQYYYGEALQTQGMHIYAQLASGAQQEVALGAVAISGYDANRIGEQEVSIGYTSQKGETLTQTFGVNVLNYEQAMELTPPARLKYYYGESLNTAGLSAKLTMADGSFKSVGATELTLSTFEPEQLGTQTITVTYQTAKGTLLSDSFEVNVVNFDTGMSVIPPTKTEYFYGEGLNKAGMSATIISASGESTTVEGSQLVLSGYSSRKLGVQTITASYTTAIGEVLQDTFTVLVKNYEKSIQAIAPDKTTYFYGESLDKEGLSAVATMADNSTQTIEKENLIVYGYDANICGTQTVNVMYRNKKNMVLTSSFTVTVYNYEQTLEIVTPPAQTDYVYGQSVSLEGIEAQVVMADGSTQAVSPEALQLQEYNPNRIGSQTIHVCYTNLKEDVLRAGFTVVFRNELRSLTLSGTYPVEFTQGDAFESTGLKVMASYADGSRKEVTAQAQLSGYDMLQEGEQTVTVTYTEGEKSVSETYTIVVQKQENTLQRADVNEDGVVDVADISVVISAANYSKEVAQATNARADADRNGIITIEDVRMLLQDDVYAHAVLAS